MKSVIVGTAGHIDHGKSALVRALTGTDPDRLEEEKRRGITIDLGFAHLEIPSVAPAAPSRGKSDTLRIGFVDVPGHERFVRNMLAGAGGIDIVLLIIAADEGIQPQTREHFDIVRLLNIRRGIAVLTKSDLVDADTLEVARLEICEFLRGSFMQDAPIVAVSSKTGAGLEELKRELATVAAETQAKDASAAPRLPVDRVFSIKGFGTVVTGTLVSGLVRKEQELTLFPGDRRLRVRGVQVHGTAAEQAVAGERTALNLAGINVEELARGMALSASELSASSRLDVRLTLLAGAKPLKDHARVHLHFHTTETIADVRLWNRLPPAGSPHSLQPGDSAYAQLRLREPWLALPGDRFILRQFSPVITIGGGVVLDAAPLSKKMRVEERIAFLETVARGDPREILQARVARRGISGLSIDAVIAETGWWPRQRVEELATGAPGLVRLAGMLVSAGSFEKAKHDLLAALEIFHKTNPLIAGIGKGELMARLGAEDTIFEGVASALATARKIEVSGEQVRLAGRGVAMKEEELESQRQIERAFASAGLKVPALRDVLAGVKVDPARAQKIVTLLLRDRVLVKLADELVFHREALDKLRALLAAQKKTSPKIDVAKFKDLTGVSRKYAIPLLEWLDRERVTRRVGDERIIL
jgi:selenocysteine-specific elongation factor